MPITNGFKYQRLSKEEQAQRRILGRLAGIIADTTNPTRNGRLYDRELWEKTLKSDLFREKIQNRCVIGELCHPEGRTETDLTLAAVALSEMPKIYPDGKVYGVFDILDTPSGQILKALCDYGTTVGISSRGSGDLITDYNGDEKVDPDSYNLECWDVVLVPAVKEARLRYVTEALDKKRYNKTLRQTLTESYNKGDAVGKKSMDHIFEDLGIDITNNLPEAFGKHYPKSANDSQDSVKNGLDIDDNIDEIYFVYDCGWSPSLYTFEAFRDYLASDYNDVNEDEKAIECEKCTNPWDLETLYFKLFAFNLNHRAHLVNDKNRDIILTELKKSNAGRLEIDNDSPEFFIVRTIYDNERVSFLEGIGFMELYMSESLMSGGSLLEEGVKEMEKKKLVEEDEMVPEEVTNAPEEADNTVSVAIGGTLTNGDIDDGGEELNSIEGNIRDMFSSVGASNVNFCTSIDSNEYGGMDAECDLYGLADVDSSKVEELRNACQNGEDVIAYVMATKGGEANESLTEADDEEVPEDDSLETSEPELDVADDREDDVNFDADDENDDGKVDDEDLEMKGGLEGQEVIDKLNEVEVGTPVMVQMTSGTPAQLTLYAGTKEIQGQTSYQFFNGEGDFGGTFGAATKWITGSNGFKADFDNIDQTKADELASKFQPEDTGEEAAPEDIPDDRGDAEEVNFDEPGEELEDTGDMSFDEQPEEEIPEEEEQPEEVGESLEEDAEEDGMLDDAEPEDDDEVAAKIEDEAEHLGTLAGLLGLEFPGVSDAIERGMESVDKDTAEDMGVEGDEEDIEEDLSMPQTQQVPPVTNPAQTVTTQPVAPTANGQSVPQVNAQVPASNPNNDPGGDYFRESVNEELTESDNSQEIKPGVYHKKRYAVTIQKVGPNVEIMSLEGPEKSGENDPYLVTGTVGEKWFIDRKHVDRYDVEGDVESGRPVKAWATGNYKVYAEMATKPEDIKTDWGQVLHADPGKDVIACELNADGTPNRNKRGVIKLEIFNNTYTPDTPETSGSRESAKLNVEGYKATNEAVTGRSKGKEIVENLKKALKQNKKLKEENRNLKEKLSVSHSKETKLNEEVARYKQAASRLSEMAKEVKPLKENLGKLNRALTESKEASRKSLNESMEAKSTLNERLTKAKAKLKDTNQKLEKSSKLAESYKANYNAVKRELIRTKANLYGVSEDELEAQLGSSFKISDIDRICESLMMVKGNMRKLNINLGESVKLSKNMKVKTARESSNTNPDDISDLSRYDDLF